VFVFKTELKGTIKFTNVRQRRWFICWNRFHHGRILAISRHKGSEFCSVSVKLASNRVCIFILCAAFQDERAKDCAEHGRSFFEYH